MDQKQILFGTTIKVEQEVRALSFAESKQNKSKCGNFVQRCCTVLSSGMCGTCKIKLAGRKETENTIECVFLGSNAHHHSTVMEGVLMSGQSHLDKCSLDLENVQFSRIVKND